MTASLPRALAAALAGGCLLACAAPAGLPAVSAFDRSALPPLVPDVADHTAARLAEAALASPGAGERAEVERALESLEAIDAVLVASRELPTGLVPAGRDLANASLDDHRAYRRASALLLRGDLDPALEQRIDQFRRDGPLALAEARVSEARRIQVARAFNTLAEPAGRSMLNWSMAPYRFGRALLAYAIQLYKTEPLPLQRRQALAHWKEYLARYPDDPEAAEIQRWVDDAQARWNRTHYRRSMRRARAALGAGRPRMALVLADRALGYLPEDEAAEALLTEAARDLEAARARQRRSLGSPPDGVDAAPAGARPLLLALLAPDADLAAEAEALLRSPDAGLADEARFARATAALEAGDEKDAWQALRKLARGDSNMARHAAALLRDPVTNSYGAFRSARRQALSRRLRMAVLGPWANGPPERGLPDWLEWPLGVTALGETAFGLPLRVIQLPWLRAPAAERAASEAARRYLVLRPEGARAEELRDWLRDFEAGRGNWLGVLALEEGRLAPDDPEWAELREKAAAQALELAAREERTGLRLAMLQRAAREFQGTEAARRAGLRVREERLRATPQRIRLSRGFLRENPELAGIAGLALRPQLLDGQSSNGELHPDGVSLLGGREIEVSLLAAGGREDDPAETRRETLDEAHLARLVSLLEETAFRKQLLDPAESFEPDARRDRFFEQARLGASELIDPRPDAASSFSYRGLRERYGMVRSRESILPFDLVVQGSLDDLSIGAFPRLREPRETPDAIFYR